MVDDFQLHDELIRLQEDVNTYAIPNEVVIEGLSASELDLYLNDITDKITESSDAIADIYVFDKIRSFLKNFPLLNLRTLARLLDVLLDAFEAEIKATAVDIDANQDDTFLDHRTALEMYGFLVHWFIASAEEKVLSNTTGRERTANARPKKGRGAAKRHDSEENFVDWNWATQKQKSLDLMTSVMELRMNKIWNLTPLRDSYVSMLTKTAHQIMENPANSKLVGVKAAVFRLLGVAVSKYNQGFAVQTTIMQNLQYYEHTGESMAEFLYVLSEQHGYSQVTDEILREISNKEFNDAQNKEVKEASNPKNFALFLVKLSELCPKALMKNLGLLVSQLDSESYTIRMANIEVIGNLITELAKSPDQGSNTHEQINSMFDILEERFLDINAFVRSKVLQVYLKILDLDAKFPIRREHLTKLATRHLEDKSSYVRKNAIKVLTKLINTHPFSMYGGELVLAEWERRQDDVQKQLEAIQPPEELQELPLDENRQAAEQRGTDDADKEPAKASSVNRADSDVEMEEADKENQESVDGGRTNAAEDSMPEEQIIDGPSAEKYNQLRLLKRFHEDAIHFIQQLHEVVPIVARLLASKTKAEVLEAMDFLVTANNYKIEAAAAGIKNMLHLIWTKDNSDEGKGVKAKLLQCYQSLYLEMDANLSEKDNINAIARNLIQLTFNTTLAELTSLEQLLSTLASEDEIDPEVIARLWAVYGVTKREIPRGQRRGAIIILGMLAKTKPEIAQEKIDLLLRIGLGEMGMNDLQLARFTCIALQRIGGTVKKEKGKELSEGVRLPMSHAIFQRIRQIVESPNTSSEWHQAINTIYLLGEHPDRLCAEIITARTEMVFQLSSAHAMDVDTTKIGTTDDDDEKEEFSSPQPDGVLTADPIQLSQLLFLVGHTAMKQIVHLEIVEAVLKRKKAANDDAKAKKTSGNSADDELEQVAGSAEDDIGEAVANIRERELLFGPDSLLATFGPILVHICSNNRVFHSRHLQIAATLALCKFMCVSAEFCETNLQLLFTILEKSDDAIIRSNLVIALGDMAICFNTIIDENISYLYKRLSDKDSLVKKNTLMVLTHLILNGMVKVKGQLGEMAKCLEDEDERISDLAKLFFTELANKDNAIYNNLPDIISNLSASENRLDEETFRKVMRFLFTFIDKDKQAENVIEKLCQRFRNTHDERLWRDIAFCLSLLPFKSDKSFKKLTEGLPFYQDKLHDGGVFQSFAEIIAKGRQFKTQKQEMKDSIDDFENKLNSFRTKGAEAQETEQIAITATKKASHRRGKAQAATTKKPRGRKAKPKKVIPSDTESED
ncbi:hypothetical protein BZG36_02281 [Bifiguratus adelaidae]|uniref:Condensin complex subunit 1 n=1 Tax=Bifiguratus adelaidae TaxID=1938954 RepID=A0A261XY78_9FUNG|nr:hypothetical protein BZG36_02281 [Bifiguratus adelaidae]